MRMFEFTDFLTNNYKYIIEHIAIEGGHAAPLEHFHLVFNFLEKHFPVR